MKTTFFIMKYNQSFFFLLLFFFGLLSCQKTEDTVQNQVSCDQKPKWEGNDSECGCYGEDMGFSKYSKFCIKRKGDETMYFGMANYGYIYDSIAVMIDPNTDEIVVFNVTEYPAWSAQRIGMTIEESINGKSPIIHSFDKSDWKNPPNTNEIYQTELHFDGKIIRSLPDTMFISTYQRGTPSAGSKLIDSTKIKIWKDMFRK